MSKQYTRRSVLATTATGLAAGLAGCQGGGGGEGTTEADMDETTTTTSDSGMNALSFEFSTLPELAAGHYEGWAIFGSEKVSTGTFSAGDDYGFSVDRDLSDADKIVVTIEPDDDPSDKPSGVVAMAGKLSGGSASLSFPVDFDDASGSYILATPSNGGDSDETAGIWWLDPSGPAPSLDLPELPGGWVYEGWAVTQGRPISTGRFSAPDEADGFAGYSGPKDTPPFPGEDLLENAPDGVSFPADLADGSSKAVISVEPDVDGTDPTGPKPFAIKPLVAEVPGDATDHTSYDMTAKPGGLPSGTATLQ